MKKILLERTPLSAGWHLSTVLAVSPGAGCLEGQCRAPGSQWFAAVQEKGRGAPKVELGQDMVRVTPHCVTAKQNPFPCYVISREKQNLFSDVVLHRSAFMTEPLRKDKTNYCSWTRPLKCVLSMKPERNVAVSQVPLCHCSTIMSYYITLRIRAIAQ